MTFVVTMQDIIGLVFGGLCLLALIGLWLMVKYVEWREKRRRRK